VCVDTLHKGDNDDDDDDDDDNNNKWIENIPHYTIIFPTKCTSFY
jgi:hypothetical protein